MSQERDTKSDSQTTKVEPTDQEKALQGLQLGQAQAADPYQRQVNQSGLQLVNSLLNGQSLPGYLNQIPGGISEDVTSGIVKQSLADIAPSFQSAGILDSGVAASISGRTAADIRTQAAQFNIQNLMQLLNQAIGGQASVQQPIMSNNQTLSSGLAGLRSTTTSGSTTTLGMNPFLKSFQSSFGETLGKSFGKVGRTDGGPMQWGGG